MNKIDLLIKSFERFSSSMWGIDSIVGVSDDEIKKIEFELNYKFEDDYKYYLSRYNGIAIPYETVYGITGRPYDDLKCCYEIEHDKSNVNPMPDYLIPFSPNGRGDHYCFNKKDNKIYFWQHDCYDYDWNPDFECNTFTEWLETTIEACYKSFEENNN